MVALKLPASFRPTSALPTLCTPHVLLPSITDRYLLFKESRKELVEDIEALKSQITGSNKE